MEVGDLVRVQDEFGDGYHVGLIISLENKRDSSIPNYNIILVGGTDENTYLAFEVSRLDETPRPTDW